MKPILFDKSATAFNTNGLGTLDAITCVVTEERNGVFELEMSIAETSLHANEIEMTSIIVAKVPDKANKQAFRVYKITKPVNGVFTAFAQHISYQLSFIPTMPFAVTASASACNQTLQGLIANAVESCPFTFATDVTTVASYKQEVPASIRSRLGGVEGSVLDQFGGEYSWDNYSVSLLAHRGVTTPTVTLRYGKNITDLNQEENIESTITGIVPYWVSSDGETTVTLPEKSIDSQYASSYPFKRTVPYDFSMTWEEQPTEAQLRAKAQAYMNAAGVGVPKVSIKLSFIDLAKTEEYKAVAAMQQVKLCDIIGVYFEKLGISTTAKIVKVVYDVLAERYDSVEIGTLRSNLAGTINANSEGVQALANNTRRMFSSYSTQVSELVDEATAWLTSGDGYVVATKDSNGNWKEILFMDTDDIDTATNVLRINQNGIGFSSTGVAGPYTQAWTLDGKMVIGGTNAPSITVYDNATPPNILFQINASGMQWNAANSSMTAAGVLTAVGAQLNNCTFESTTSSNKRVYIASGRIVFGQNSNAYIEYSPETYNHRTFDSLKVYSNNYLTLENSGDSSIRLGPYWYNNRQMESILLQAGYSFASETGGFATIEMLEDEHIYMEQGRYSGHTAYISWFKLSEDLIDIETNGDIIIHAGDNLDLSGDVYINNNEVNGWMDSYNGPITDLDWDWDYDTGCMNYFNITGRTSCFY